MGVPYSTSVRLSFRTHSNFVQTTIGLYQVVSNSTRRLLVIQTIFASSSGEIRRLFKPCSRIGPYSEVFWICSSNVRGSFRPYSKHYQVTIDSLSSGHDQTCIELLSNHYQICIGQLSGLLELHSGTTKLSSRVFEVYSNF